MADLPVYLCRTSLLMYLIVQGSQTEHEYSRIGLMVALYAHSLTDVELIFRLVQNSPRVLVALVVTLLI